MFHPTWQHRVEEIISKTIQYRKNPVYMALKDLYIEATMGNQVAYNELLYYAKLPLSVDSNPTQGIQPIAIHFLGKLRLTPDFIDLIYKMLANLSASSSTPILYESSFILLKVATPKAWETLINIHISRSYRIANYAIEWIGYLTDLLSGETPTIPKSIRPREHECFFDGLDNISEDDFKELKRLFRA